MADAHAAEKQSSATRAQDSRVDGMPTAGAGHRDADAEGDAATEARQQLSELQAALQRERADFLNYRRRVTQERDDAAHSARIGVFRTLVPMLDDLELALQQTPASGAQEPWVEGYRLVARKLMRALEQAGVARIGAVGETFDPHAHEAIGQRPPAHPGERPRTIGEVVRPGYRLNDYILRPAQVIIIGDAGRDSAESNGT